MIIVFDSNYSNTTIYTKKFCVSSVLRNKQGLNHFMPDSANNAKTRKLACNIKHMTIVFDSNHSNTVIFTKKYCVPSFTPNKLWLNHFMR